MARAPSVSNARPPLHPLDLRILMALVDGPGYGTRIVAEVEEREGGRMRLYPASLFRRIRDLGAQGLLEEALRRRMPTRVARICGSRARDVRRRAPRRCGCVTCSWTRLG